MNTKPIGNSESKAAKEKYSKLAIQSIEFSRRSDEITKEMNSLQKELGKRKLAGQRTVDIYEKMDSLSKEKTELTSASTEIQNQLGILNADVDYFTGEELKEGITSIFGSCDKLALEFYQAMQKAGELFKQLKEKDRVYFQSAMWLSAHCIQPPLISRKINLQLNIQEHLRAIASSILISAQYNNDNEGSKEMAQKFHDDVRV